MPRRDENGRQLHLVVPYLLDTLVTDFEMRTALGIADNRAYQRQRERDDFPSAEDCRRVAQHFRLNPVELMVRFGLLDDGQIREYTEGRYAARSTRSRTSTRNKRGHLPLNPDVPPV